MLQLRRDADDLDRWLDVRTRLFEAARRARAPGARRQGGGRLERPGDQRPGAPRPAVGGATARRRGAGGGRAAAGRCTWWAAGCAASPATASSARRRACWRTTAASPHGFLDLLQATGDVRWLERAGPDRRRARPVRAPTTAASTTPPTTPSSSSHGPATRPTTPSPSGLSALLHALVTVAALTGEQRYRAGRRGRARLGARCSPTKAPRFAGWSLAAAVALLDGPAEIAVVGPAGRPPGRPRQQARATIRPRWSLVADMARDDVPAAGRARRRSTGAGGVRLSPPRLRGPGHRPAPT